MEVVLIGTVGSGLPTTESACQNFKSSLPTVRLRRRQNKVV